MKRILCTCSENRVRPEFSIPATGQNDRGSGDENDAGAAYLSVPLFLYGLKSQSIYLLSNPIHWPAHSQVWQPNLLLANPWGQSSGLTQPGRGHKSGKETDSGHYLTDTYGLLTMHACSVEMACLRHVCVFMEARRSQLKYFIHKLGQYRNYYTEKEHYFLAGHSG